MDLDALRRSYERSAATYDERFRELQCEKYRVMLGDGRGFGGGPWLDLGCGTGLLAAYLTERGCDATALVGIDFSRGMLAYARARGMRAAEARIDALPFRDASFGVVVAFTAFRIVRDDAGERRTLSEVARVLTPGGVLVLTVLRADDDRTLVTRLGDAGLRLDSACSCGQDIGYRCVRV